MAGVRAPAQVHSFVKGILHASMSSMVRFSESQNYEKKKKSVWEHCFLERTHIPDLGLYFLLVVRDHQKKLLQQQ